MAISLSKGQGVSLKKSENNLSEVTIGLGWDVNVNTGFFGRIFGGKSQDYDLDAIAFLLDENDKIITLDNLKTKSDIVFYNNMAHKSGAIWLTGDNRTGAGDGDDEQIIIKLDTLPQEYKKVLLLVQIFQGIERGQSFSDIKNAFVRAVDKTGKEMCRFDLSGDPSYADCRLVTFAELARQGSDWKFNAIGKPYQTDGFWNIINEYQ